MLSDQHSSKPSVSPLPHPAEGCAGHSSAKEWTQATGLPPISHINTSCNIPAACHSPKALYWQESISRPMMLCHYLSKSPSQGNAGRPGRSKQKTRAFLLQLMHKSLQFSVLGSMKPSARPKTQRILLEYRLFSLVSCQHQLHLGGRVKLCAHSSPGQTA